jgi:hypothetical protein
MDSQSAWLTPELHILYICVYIQRRAHCYCIINDYFVNSLAAARNTTINALLPPSPIAIGLSPTQRLKQYSWLVPSKYNY